MTGIASGPPTVAIGTIGTPVLIAIFTKPVRPASSAVSRRNQWRSESISPPGQSATSRPAARALVMLSGAAGSTPIFRKYQPISGVAIKASCAVPWMGRSSPKRRHHMIPTVQASQTNGAPEWTPIRSVGGSGIFSQPSTSIRNQ